MTRREKKNPITGSALLGAELRRLRGIRTLDEIAALSSAPPLAGSVPPVSASTISDVETGKQMPKLLTLYTFSMVYRVSMNQLMGYVVEEALARTAMELQHGSDSEPQAAFARLLGIGEWHRALPLAIHCERAARTESERISWRANRASCLANVGLHTEAITLLTACLENSQASDRQQFVILRNLADIHAAGGSFRTASLLVREALDKMPAEATPGEIGALERLRASLIIDMEELRPTPNDRAVRDAIRLTESAEKATPDDVPGKLRARFLRARGYRLLGNRLVAARDFEAMLGEAVDLRYPAIEARAALELARLRREAGLAAQAESLLERARSVGEAGQQNDVLFEASFELFRLLRADRPDAAVTHFRRCRELLPLLPPQAPSIQAFERFAQEMTG